MIACSVMDQFWNARNAINAFVIVVVAADVNMLRDALSASNGIG